MAKSKSNNRQGKIVQLHPNKKSYFESGRVSRLPMGKCYLKLDYPEPNYMTVVITRDHINQNLSFSEFIIDSGTGEIMDAFYDFNVDSQSFLFVYAEGAFTEFEDHDSLQHLVYSTGLPLLGTSHPIHQDARIAKLILEDKVVIASKAKSLIKLARFQMDDSEAATRTTFDLRSKVANDDFKFYDPQKVMAWTEKDWLGYFEKIKAMDVSARLACGISPLAYIYEYAYWGAKWNNPKLASDIKRLSRHETAPLTKHPTMDFGYDPGEEESILMISMFNALRQPMSKTEILDLLDRIKPLTIKYPNNPEFANQVYYCYERMGNRRMSAQSAEKAMLKHPGHPEALANYLKEMVIQHEMGKIKDRLKGIYLLDDLFPGKESFHDATFLNYYFLLFQYLMMSQQFEAGWELHAAIRTYDVFLSVDAMKQKLWWVFYTHPAAFVAESIDNLISNDQVTKELAHLLATKIGRFKSS